MAHGQRLRVTDARSRQVGQIPCFLTWLKIEPAVREIPSAAKQRIQSAVRIATFLSSPVRACWLSSLVPSVFMGDTLDGNSDNPNGKCRPHRHLEAVIDWSVVRTGLQSDLLAVNPSEWATTSVMHCAMPPTRNGRLWAQGTRLGFAGP